MNWDAIGAVGEVVGAAGVIISLLYLAVQIRGDARAKRAATTHEQSVASRELLLAIARDRDFGEVFLRGIYDFNSLEGADLPRFSAFCSAMCRLWEDQLFQWAEGHLDLRIWRAGDASIDDLFSMPGVQAWWKTRKHWFSDKFQAFVEEKLSHQKAPTMYQKQFGPHSGSKVFT